ncbi:dimethyladenosine transferase 2, mitochondrial isoform 1-T2 [Rhinophrynus dorsalis]
MSSLGGARLGLCVLRCGPLAQAFMPCCFKQRSKLVDFTFGLNSPVNPGGSRGMSAVAGQKKSHLCALDMQDINNELKTAESFRQFRRFIADPGLAKTVLNCLQTWDQREGGPLIIECNPGPGVFTRTLLDAGYRVVALESSNAFLPFLQVLQNRVDGQLQVVHCDFFRLDPFGQGTMQPPAMYSDALFESLGVSEVPWTADVPIKVFVMVSQKNENCFLWKHIYNLYERMSIYKYGRIELNMFLSEKQYKRITSPPGDMRNYRALSVLYQAACDIQLLHMEPWSSFLTPSRFRGTAVLKSVLVPNDHFCLVRLTPRKDLFNDRFTTEKAEKFIIMIRQYLAKRKAKLIDRVNSWDPGNGEMLLKQLEIPEDVVTGNIYPEQYIRLFEAMEHTEEFNKSWMFDELLENIQSTRF